MVSMDAQSRCPILSSLSAPDGNQQGPCMGFPVCSPWQAVHAHYMSVSLYYILVRSRLYQVGRFVILWGMLTSVRCKIGWFVRPAESIRIKAHQNVFWWTSDSGSWAVSICLFSWVVHVQEQDSSGIMTCKMTCRCLRFRQSTAATGLDLDGFCSLFRFDGKPAASSLELWKPGASPWWMDSPDPIISEWEDLPIHHWKHQNNAWLVAGCCFKLFHTVSEHHGSGGFRSL
jgi:hypothetical protein